MTAGSGPDPRLHPHRQVLDDDTRRARALISNMGRAVEEAISRAIRALLDVDAEVAEAVVAGDVAINAMQYELRDLCFTIILTQAPMARDLREVLGFHHMAAELERMGDHCVGIARIALAPGDGIDAERAADIATMAELCAEQVHEIIDALMARDVQRAREIAARDTGVDVVYRAIFRAMMKSRAAASVAPSDATSIIFVAHHLERIGDRVTNLAEDLVYLETGTIEELG